MTPPLAHPTLSTTIRAILRRTGLTQSSLSRAAQVDRKTIHNLINCNYRPQRAVLARIGEILGNRQEIMAIAGYDDCPPVNFLHAIEQAPTLTPDGRIVCNWLTDQSPSIQRRVRELVDLVFVRGWM